MRHKPKKTSAERSAENYFPVSEENLKYAIEKSVKEKEEIIEIISNGKKTIKPRKGKPRKISSKKSYSKKSPNKKFTRKKSEISFSPQEINLRKNGYELIITEKPQAAAKIASALGKSTQRNLGGVSYFELNKNGKEIVVACAVGHLFTLSQTKSGSNIPVFDIQWLPNFLVRKKDFTKKYYDIILKLAKNAGSITIATDYDIEGEVIGLNVVKYICNQKDANRMKFSTLTPNELNESYEKKSPTLNWGQAIAGETRHYLDWFYGINLSRALMNAIKSTGKFRIMSIGRVQGPALNLIVQKERQIQSFKSQKYWQVFISLENYPDLELKYTKDIFNKPELKKFENLAGKTGEARTTKKQQILQPNPPFNLTELQMEAYRLHGITPARTLQIAQSLYLNGLISYPRTSSQKLPDSISYKEILDKLSRQYKAERLIKRLKPIEGKKSDPAHPSIYPTGNNPEALSSEEEKIYNLIVKRFLSLFCEDAIVDNKTINVEVDNLNFSTRGSEIKKKAWMEIYPIKIKEVDIPDINGKVKITKVRNEEKETQPPKRFSPASIVSELEKRNLGTKATRASIVETLFDRGYVKDKSIEATPLGISLISTLEKHSPVIIDEQLTRHFEKEMDSIIEAKKDFLKKEERIVDEAKKTITEIANQFEKNEKEIGGELVQATTQSYEREREENKLNQCPVCKKGNLAIRYSKKTRRQFVACDAYPNCKTTYSLPPNGLIKRTDKVCEKCGFPMLIRLTKGKRPWEFCFNKDCETNKKRLEEYREKKEKEEEK
ncbi:MAG: DNA topoisomerase I [Nanoarchaeota archaeon]|nr:DNA topoisomerase I [Nanoarchaeota archaeon]